MNIGLSYFVNLIHDKKIGKIKNANGNNKETEECEEGEEEETEEYEEYEVSEENVKRGQYVKKFVCCW